MRPNSSTSMSTKPAKSKVPVWKKIVLVLGVILCSLVVFAASFAGAWVLIGSQDFSSDTAELKDKIETLETENKALKDQVKDMDSGASKGSSKATDTPSSTKTPATSATPAPKATQKPSSTSSNSGSSGGGTNSSATSKPTQTEKPAATKAPATAPPATQKPSSAGGNSFDIPTINID